MLLPVDSSKSCSTPLRLTRVALSSGPDNVEFLATATVADVSDGLRVELDLSHKSGCIRGKVPRVPLHNRRSMP